MCVVRIISIIILNSGHFYKVVLLYMVNNFVNAISNKVKEFPTSSQPMIQSMVLLQQELRRYSSNTSSSTPQLARSQEKSSHRANWHSQEQTPSARKGIVIKSTRSDVNRGGVVSLFFKF